MPKKLITYIVPCYNEADNIRVFYSELKKNLNKLNNYRHEIIFIDDGSSDNTLKEILKCAKKDKQVKYLEFSRNFGKEAAVSAGLHAAKGRAAIILDSDLQHPPRYIKDFIESWEGGAEMVVGIRENRDYTGLTDQLTSFIFYKLVALIKDTPLILGETDFRLVDRAIINEFNLLSERNRITRGMLDWLGFSKKFVNFRAQERQFGQTKYSQFRRAKLALSALISHSQFPIHAISYLGVFIVFFSGLMGIFILIEKYFLEDPLNLKISGNASLGTLILFLMGIVLVTMGVLSQYILKIRDETLNRPLYIVRKKKL